MNTYYFAPLYDVLLQPFIHKMRLKTATIANSLKVNTAIDLCCGTGHQLKYLRKAGIDAEGVDLN
ncbi:MAG: class I SAM-dependent methyltransferase, partial [Bacteroidota bacterium]